MNSVTYSNRKILFTIGAIAIVTVGAIGLSALFAHASTGPTVTTTVTNSSNAVVTSAAIGSNVFAGAMVASSTSSTSPTGTVNFSTFANQTCTGSPTVQSGIALHNGMASSSAATQTAAGLSFLINYNGDASNTPSVSTCAAVSPTSGSVTVTPTLSANTVNAGSSVTAGATLGGNTGAATGTVAYNFFTNNACTLGTTSPASVTVANGSVPTSAATVFNQPGTYYLQAVYSGDQNNAAATSSCGSQVLTVNSVAPTQNATSLSLGLSTTSAMAGNSVNATATLGGQTAAAGGSVAYNVYSDNACTAALSGAGTMSVTNGIVPNSTSIIFNTPGTFFWRAVYSGDTNNAMATSSCAALTITASSTNSGGGSGTPGSISGTLFNDLNKNDVKDGSEGGLSGWTVWLHKGGNYDGAIVATATTDANGNYSFANLANGKYFVEEQEKAGWEQTTDDTAVTLSASMLSGIVNFANVQNATSTGTGNNHDGKGKHIHNGKGDNDNDDNASSTNNGNHNGWFNGLIHGLKVGWFNHSN